MEHGLLRTCSVDLLWHDKSCKLATALVPRAEVERGDLDSKKIDMPGYAESSHLNSASRFGDLNDACCLVSDLLQAWSINQSAMTEDSAEVWHVQPHKNQLSQLRVLHFLEKSNMKFTSWWGGVIIHVYGMSFSLLLGTF